MRIYCQHCKTTEGTFVKNGRKTLKDGTLKQRYLCNPCNTIRVSKYISTENGKAAIRRSALKYEKQHPERRKAWRKVRNFGTKPCEECGILKTDKHHPDINKALEVVWLCRYHHKQAHKMLIAV